MTESEWLASTDPAAMLAQFVPPGGRSSGSGVKLNSFPISDRKLELVCQAVVPGFYPDHPAQWLRQWASIPGRTSHDLQRAASAFRDIVSPFRPVTLPHCCVRCGCTEYEPEVEYVACARCGNDMTARQYVTPQVLSIARAAYDLREWDRLPVLADALEDAGCTDEAILTHLRGPGPHVRGCFVLDALLGLG